MSASTCRLACMITLRRAAGNVELWRAGCWDPAAQACSPPLAGKRWHALSRADAHAKSTAAGGVCIGAQAWGLATKLREVDEAMSTERQTVVFEVHPELCFWAMNGRQPMPHAKKTGVGENNRIAALIKNAVPETFLDKELGKLGSTRDDFLDGVHSGLDGAAGLQQCGRASAQKRGARQSGPRHGYVGLKVRTCRRPTISRSRPLY